MKRYFKKGMLIVGIIIWGILLLYSVGYYNDENITGEEIEEEIKNSTDIIEVPEICRNLDLSKDEIGKRMYGLHTDEGDYIWAEKECLIELDNPNIREKGLELKLQTILENLKQANPDIVPKVKLYINGIYIEEYNLFDKCQTYKISEDKIPNTDINHYFIELVCNTSFILSELEESQDNRELAFQILYIGERQ